MTLNKNLNLVANICLIITICLAASTCHGGGQIVPVPPVVTTEIAAEQSPPANYLFVPVTVLPQQPQDFSGKQVLNVQPTVLRGNLDLTRHATEASSGLIRFGSQYSAELHSSRINIVGEALEFTPQFSGGDLSGLAYCMFAFELTDYNGNPALGLEWDDPPSPSQLWIGVGNQARDAWDWYEGPMDDVLTLESLDPYTSPQGSLLVALVLTGSDSCVLNALRVGSYEMRPLGALEAETAPDTPPLAGAAMLPGSVDLSSGCSPVRQQYPWQSCTAFAVGDGAYNYELNAIYGDYGWDFANPFNLVSPKYIYVESGKAQNKNSPTIGRYTEQVIAGLQDDYGAATEQNAPYDYSYDDHWIPAAIEDASLLSISKWEGVPCNTMAGVNSVKAILAFQERPVVMRTELDAGISAFKPGLSTAWNYSGPTIGGHAMCIVGYDNAKSAFLVRNSWGAEWGNDGYLWIGYNTFTNPDAYVRCWTLRDDYDPAVAQRFCGLTAPLAPPVDVQATDGLYNIKVTVTWVASPSATGYKIYRDQPANMVASLGNVNTWDDTALDDTYAHCYWVQATKDAQSSQLSSPDWGYLESAGIGYDESEDNDSSATANPLPPLPVAGFKGSIGDGGYDGDHYDYFTFEAAAGQVLTVDLDYNQVTANVYLALYDGEGWKLAEDDIGNDGTRHVEFGLHAGTHFLRIYGANGTSDYTLACTLEHAGYQEVEDNDGLSEADPITLPVSNFKGSVGPGGTPASGGYDGDNYDYFGFEVEEGDLLDATITYDNGAGANFTLRLYDSDGWYLADDSDGNSGTRTVQRGLKAGSYYLRIYAAEEWGDYYLTASLTPGGYDEVEDNDEISDADVIILPVTDFKASVGPGGTLARGGYDGDDYDYFTFVAEEGDLLDATITYDNGAGANFGFRLYDADGWYFANDSSGNPGSRSLKRGLKAGSYCLRVNAAEEWGDYYLTASLTPGNYDETEDNDDLPEADVLSLPASSYKGSVGTGGNDPHGGYDGDTNDYSTFTLSSAATVTITVTYEPTETVILLRLLDDSGWSIASDTSGNSGTRSITEALPAGDYYIRVWENGGYGDYSMDVSSS